MKNKKEWLDWKQYEELSVLEIINYKVNEVYIVDKVARTQLRKFVRNYSIVYYDECCSDYENTVLYYNNLVTLALEELQYKEMRLEEAVEDDCEDEIEDYEKQILYLNENMYLMHSVRDRILRKQNTKEELQ